MNFAQPTDAAAQLLHRIKVAHGLQQWRKEAARLFLEYERTRDARHLRALRTHNEAISEWERKS